MLKKLLRAGCLLAFLLAAATSAFAGFETDDSISLYKSMFKNKNYYVLITYGAWEGEDSPVFNGRSKLISYADGQDAIEIKCHKSARERAYIHVIDCSNPINTEKLSVDETGWLDTRKFIKLHKPNFIYEWKMPTDSRYDRLFIFTWEHGAPAVQGTNAVDGGNEISEVMAKEISLLQWVSD